MLLRKLISTSARFLSKLPAPCVFCSRTTKTILTLCRDCLHDLPILSHSCRYCAQFLSVTDLSLICGVCLSHPPPFDCTYALFRYQAPIIKLITQLKFHAQLSHAKLLGELFAEKILSDWYMNKPLPDLIIPMPLSYSRLRERGFNQALEIAKPIAKHLNIPIDKDGVIRIKFTAAQSSLPASMRKSNVQGAFQITGDYAKQHVAIIDDVITTGHTVTELSHSIRKKGVTRIDVWCAARCDLAENLKSL